MDEVFMMFAAECEGDIPTHQGKINLFIKRLAESDSPNSAETQQAIFDEIGLDFDSLSFIELDYIEQEVSKRVRWRNSR